MGFLNIFFPVESDGKQVEKKKTTTPLSEPRAPVVNPGAKKNEINLTEAVIYSF